jgi:aspartate racemase
MKKRRTAIPGQPVGVLGGMGPAATIEFFRRLVAATPAGIDQAHLRILIDNNPQVPDRSNAIFRRGTDPGPVLAAMAQGLEAAGAGFLTMPCNTAHVFQQAIREAVSIPFIDMIEETVQTLTVSRAGLLATTGTVHTRIYHMACSRRGIDLVIPSTDDQELIMDIIRRLKAGGTPASVCAHAIAVVGHLIERGAEAIIAGCTEISLIPGQSMPVPWVDALDCLVGATVRTARSQTQPRAKEER